jgi:type II secretory pathway component PulL
MVKNFTQKQAGQKETIDLLQSDYSTEKFSKKKLPYLKTLVSLGVIWGLSHIFLMGYQWQKLKSEAEYTKQQVEQLFFITFPDKKRLVDVKVQTETEIKLLTQRVKQNDSFVMFLAAVAETIQGYPDIQIQQLKYVDGSLQVEMTSARFMFTTLESQISSQYNLRVEEQSSFKSGTTVSSLFLIRNN